MPITLSPENEALLEQLPEPKLVWRYMLALTQIPRGSNTDGRTDNLKAVLTFLKERAEELGHETIVDKAENLLVRRKASPGYEDKPCVCVQGHMDMVCQKNDDVEIDFLKDPLKPRIVDDKYLMATGTSLGGDNGIGVAMAFALLEDEDLKCGPIEVLITKDEEIGLIGASQIEPGLLKAKYLINADSEEENSVCVGCAGSFSIHMTLPSDRETDESAVTTGYVRKTFVLNDFLGGHSGCDIHLGRAHPMQVMGRLLMTIADQDYRVVAINCGTARNAIPRKCVLDLAVAKECEAEVTKRMETEFGKFFEEYKLIEKDASFLVKDTDATQKGLNPLTIKATKACASFMTLYPFGVLRVSPAKADFIQTSTNCGIASVDEAGNFVFTSSVRSSSSTQLDFVYNKIVLLTRLLGMTLSDKFSAYPGWEPNLDSQLTKVMVESYEVVTGQSPLVYSIHAGLECGLLLDKYPHLDCTSIGPELHFPHTPRERLMISSVAPCCTILKRCLTKLSE